MEHSENFFELEKLDKHFTPDVLVAMAEVQQARSNFQLEKFVVGQHDTVEMQYVQTLLELQNIYYTIKTVSLQMKKTEIEIKKLKASGDETDEIEAQIKELGLEQTRLVGIGSFRELDKLMKLFNSFEHKYTREEIESAQEEYWSKRLNRQAVLQALGGTANQASHLDSLRQIGAIEVTADNRVVPKDSTKSMLESIQKEIEL